MTIPDYSEGAAMALDAAIEAIQAITAARFEADKAVREALRLTAGTHAADEVARLRYWLLTCPQLPVQLLRAKTRAQLTRDAASALATSDAVGVFNQTREIAT